MNDDALIDRARRWSLDYMEESAGHDTGHIRRVVTNARRLAQQEGADELVVRLAAWMHDLVNLPKDHPGRSSASKKSATVAGNWLDGRIDDERIELIKEAIRCHSFSAGLEPESLEAQVVSDADNLDAIGAIGIGRAFEVGGALGRITAAPEDPLCKRREPDDGIYTLDHFFTKLLQLQDQFYTDSGRREARRRIQFMEDFLEQLERELE